MLATSKGLNQKREHGNVIQPLRQVLCLKVFEELVSRASQLKFGSSEDALIMRLQSQEVLTPSNGCRTKVDVNQFTIRVSNFLLNLFRQKQSLTVCVDMLMWATPRSILKLSGGPFRRSS